MFFQSFGKNPMKGQFNSKHSNTQAQIVVFLWYF